MNFCKLGLAVVEIESQAITSLADRIDESFEHACQLIMSCKGRVIVTGMGKSGHIGKKIAATMASTGTPAFFVHPGEASHGDLGMITSQDVVLAISYSGNTAEIVTLIPLLKRMQVPLISLTGNPASSLALASDAHINVSVANEACPFGLAPTSSSTAALVMGDALSIALLQARGFTEADFARAHPGGSLGKRLLLYVEDICHKDDEIPIIDENASVSEALLEVTAKKLGMTCVVNKQGALIGIYTDGDIRRTLTRSLDIHTTSLSAVMTTNCKTIGSGILAAEALALMQKYSITALVVVDDEKHPKGVIHMHDLLKAGVY